MTASTRNGPRVRVHPPSVGAFAQFVVLAALAVSTGLGTVGWLVGAGYAGLTWILLSRALRAADGPAWGPANTVTLVRLTLAGGVTAMVADSFSGPVPLSVLTALAAVSLLLDAVDGQVARRTGTSSRLGARFDMEADSVLVLVLSLYVATSLGWWVLAIGAFRYAFVAASWALPWLQAPLAPRMSRKVVAAVQGIVLVVASAGILPVMAASVMVGSALGTLIWSFGTDVRWLWALPTRTAAAASVPASPVPVSAPPVPVSAPEPARVPESAPVPTAIRVVGYPVLAKR